MSSDGAILTGVRSLWEEDLLQDYTIYVESRSFKVHKVILAGVSDYFRAMLTGGMAESSTDSVKLGVVSAGAMEVLIHFIYKNTMSLTDTNVVDVLSGAVYLQIPSAIELCTQYMVDNLDTENCFDVYAALQKDSFPEDTEHVKSFIMDNMEAIVNEGNMRCMPYELFCYVKDEWRGSEMILFQFVQKWVEADPENRKEHLADVMAEIRFCLLTPEDLREVKTLKVFEEDCCAWKKLVDEAVDYHNSPLHKKVLNGSVQNTVRSPPAPAVFTAQERSNFLTATDYNNLDLDFYILDEEKRWVVCDFPMPKYVGNLSFHVEVNNFLICTTSPYTRTPYNFYVFDPRTLTWSQLTSLEVQKDDYALLYHEEHLYVIGGTLGKSQTVTDSIERYSFLTDTWSHFTTLPYPQVSLEACVYQGSIYVTGGLKRYHSGENHLTDVQCLNLTTKVWEPKAAATPGYELPPSMSFVILSLFVMTLHREEVLCLLDRNMQLSYYTAAANQWTSFKYSLGGGRRFLRYDDGSVIITDNTIYYIDHFDYGNWENEGICMELTFPEEGTEVIVNHINHFFPLGYMYPRTCSAMLSVPSEKITADVVEQEN